MTFDVQFLFNASIVLIFQFSVPRCQIMYKVENAGLILLIMLLCLYENELLQL